MNHEQTSPPGTSIDIRCLQCGYALAGNASGRCPECGLRFDADNPNHVWSPPRRFIDDPQARGSLYALAFMLSVVSLVVGGVAFLALASLSLAIAAVIPGTIYGLVVLVPIALQVTPKWIRPKPALALIPLFVGVAFIGGAFLVEWSNEAMLVFPGVGAAGALVCVAVLWNAIRVRHLPHWAVIPVFGSVIGSLMASAFLVPAGAGRFLFLALMFALWQMGVAMLCVWSITSAPLVYRSWVFNDIDGGGK